MTAATIHKIEFQFFFLFIECPSGVLKVTVITVDRKDADLFIGPSRFHPEVIDCFDERN